LISIGKNDSRHKTNLHEAGLLLQEKLQENVQKISAIEALGSGSLEAWHTSMIPVNIIPSSSKQPINGNRLASPEFSGSYWAF
jgi:hypothetical protein